MKKFIKNKSIKSVTTITPHRISFAGGGTDYSNFYKKFEGEVINCTIDQYLFITVKKHGAIYPEKYRLMYSKTEFCNTISDIKNNIARECLRIVPIDIPITIQVSSDLPAESGTGSSSSFAVGLLNALYNFKGESVSASQIAKEACKIEVEVLKKNCGRQDQYAASFGGFNKFIFKKNNNVLIEPLNISKKNLEKLFSNLKLIWTGEIRNSSKIASSYNFKSQKIINYLLDIKYSVSTTKNILQKKELNLKKLSETFKYSWNIKKLISKKITTTKINKFGNILDLVGINGYRIIGAGGGGFFLCIASKKQIKKLNKYLPKAKILDIKYEPKGSKVLSILYNK
jgi:D-glycero-alpha-D-manno-heptose-7-phosphate kinase